MRKPDHGFPRMLKAIYNPLTMNMSYGNNGSVILTVDDSTERNSYFISYIIIMVLSTFSIYSTMSYPQTVNKAIWHSTLDLAHCSGTLGKSYTYTRVSAVNYLRHDKNKYDSPKCDRQSSQLHPMPFVCMCIKLMECRGAAAH